MRRLGWPKGRRLLQSGRFTDCYEHGRKTFTRHFVLFILPRPIAKQDEEPRPGEGFRLGLTVSRKVGRAVRRNRVRRVLREFFRLHQAEIAGALDVVVVPKRNLDPKGITLALVQEEFLPVVARLGRAGAAGTTHGRP